MQWVKKVRCSSQTRGETRVVAIICNKSVKPVIHACMLVTVNHCRRTAMDIAVLCVLATQNGNHINMELWCLLESSKRPECCS